jgi:hypothetical protein
MTDAIWFILMGVLFVLLGILFIVLGWLIWKKQKMNLIIRYHCDKVREENKEAYCKLAGIGVLLMGLGFLLSGIFTVFFQSVFTFIPMAAGLVIGIALLISAVVKYNH